MDLNKIYKEVAVELGLSEKVIQRVYNIYWKSVKHHLSTMPIKQRYTEEEFKKIRNSVNIPSIGKFKHTYSKHCKYERKIEFLENKNKEDV